MEDSLEDVHTTHVSFSAKSKLKTISNN